MRGADITQESLFTTVHLETFVPADHPLRPIRAMVNEALGRMSWLFNAMYAEGGRESIPPERLVRAMLLQVLYSVRSERHLMEQLNYNLLFRWFVGLAIDDPVWNHSVFSKNRERLMEHGVVETLFDEILAQAEREDWLSREHFSVDGTLVRAWASHKSFRPRDGDDDGPPTGGGRNVAADFRGQKRCNDTHASTTDPDALLYRKSKGTPSMLCYQGHLVTENRNGLVVRAAVSQANGTGERETALRLLGELPGAHRKTVGADRNYDTRGFVQGVRELGITPHVACNDSGNRSSRVDGRTTRHQGYALSQDKRKQIEEHFGWGKTVGGLVQTMYRGLERVGQHFCLTMIGSNLVRMRTLALTAGPS